MTLQDLRRFIQDWLRTLRPCAGLALLLVCAPAWAQLYGVTTIPGGAVMLGAPPVAASSTPVVVASIPTDSLVLEIYWQDYINPGAGQTAYFATHTTSSISMIQATDINKPASAAGGGLYFDGNDKMVVNQTISPNLTSASFTVVLVASSTVNSMAYCGTPGYFGGVGFYGLTPTFGWFTYQTVPGYSTIIPSTTVTGSGTKFVAFRTGANAILNVNSASATSDMSVEQGPSGTFTLGQSPGFTSYFTGTIYSMLLYNRRLTDEEIETCKTVLVAREGITLSP